MCVCVCELYGAALLVHHLCMRAEKKALALLLQCFDTGVTLDFGKGSICIHWVAGG